MDVAQEAIVLVTAVFVAILGFVYLFPLWFVASLFFVFIIIFVVVVIIITATSRNFNEMLLKNLEDNNAAIEKELTQLRLDLQELVRTPAKPRRLPAVFGRLIDDALQNLIYLALRDFVGAWNTEQGFSSTVQLTSDIREDVWKVVKIIQERLSKIDEAKLICSDITSRVIVHFEKIRNSTQPFRFGPLDIEGNSFQILPHLNSENAQLDYLRRMSTAMIVLFFPKTYSTVEPVKHLLRELLACKVFFPAIETLTDPDFINLKIISFIEQNQQPAEQQLEGQYERPPHFDHFVNLIKSLNDIETLKRIRYDLVTDIMTAARNQGDEPTEEMKQFLNKLTFAKNQCEKRLHELGWMGYPVEIGVEANADVGDESLPLLNILIRPTGRQYFMEYLKQIECPGYVGYWIAVEQLRKAPRTHWHALGAEIYYTYITTPTLPIRIEKTLLRKIEDFLLGDGSASAFFEVQQLVVFTLTEKIFPTFQMTELYARMLKAMQSQDEDEVLPDDDINVGLGDDEAEQALVDQSNYSHNKLSQLEERLSNKLQALQALRASLKPESRVLTKLEAEVEEIQGEIRQLEAHLTRTEEWGEHLGQWRAVVQLAEMSEDKECPQFVLVVHHEDEQDSDSIATGWVVLRKLQDFQELHRQLCQLSSDVKNLELPTQSLKYRLGKTTVQNTLEKAKALIQKYLQFILEDERLNQSEALYTFLSPSSRHLKHNDLEPVPKKFKFSLATMFKNNGRDRDQNRDTPRLYTIAPDGNIVSGPIMSDPNEDDASPLVYNMEDTKIPADNRDTIAEPLYLLLNELCCLNTKYNWIRRTLITTIQLTYNRSINRAVRAIVREWFSEKNVYNCIQHVTKAWWPESRLVTGSPNRTQTEKQTARNEARQQLLDNIPLLLSTLVGHQSAQLAAATVFDALQNPLMNKHIFYEIVELVLDEICPEMKSQ